MRLNDFKDELRTSLERICHRKSWTVDNNKQRGMAFEDWCFDLLAERYPAAENDREECVIRSDDSEIDVVFESKETAEIYLLQCKHPKIAATDPIPESEVKSFFSTYQLLKDRDYLDRRKTYNPKIQELAVEFAYWQKQTFVTHLIFVSSGRATEKTSALVEKYNRDHQNQNVKFDVWDIGNLRNEYVAVKSVEEQYPSEVTFVLAEDHYLVPDGTHENITFALRGTIIQELALKYKDSLFNWNIRGFLGKKGEVNAGLSETIESEPSNFFY